MLDFALQGAADRVFERLVAGLQTEFGRDAAEGLARTFVEAEGGDFYWDARDKVRWLGAYESLEEETDGGLDRIAVTGLFDGRFYVAILVLDSKEAVQAMLGVRQFESRMDANEAFAAAH